MSTVAYDVDFQEVDKYYQWDTNQKLTAVGIVYTDIPVFHFYNRLSEEAIVVVPGVTPEGELTVDIPNELLRQPEVIFAYACDSTVEDESLKVIYAGKIPVIPRPKPIDYEYIDNINYPSYASLSARLLKLETQVGPTLDAIDDALDGINGEVV